MRLTGQEVAEASRGVWLSTTVPAAITGIGTDSRNFVAGDAFLALRGMVFDGHQHAAMVASKAAALIGDVQGSKQWGNLNTPQLQVGDTLQALGDIAACHRNKLQQTQVVAITGSYGKTTVRSMLAHILETLGLEVASTKENFNNLIGVPKTLLAVEPSADVALIECGISELGEMERLSEIVQPDVAIITGLTHAHGEGLGDLKDIVCEKVKLIKHLLPQGWCLFGTGVARHLAEANCEVAQMTYHMEDDDAVSWSLDKTLLRLSFASETYEFELLLPAKHWAEDMALAATVALKLAGHLNKKWLLKDVAETLATWSPVEGRMRVYPTSPEQNYTLIDDSYNANPASMQAALDTLAALDGYKVAIVGDMLELGERSVSMHAQLDFQGINEVIAIGTMMKARQEKKTNEKIRYFENVQAFQLWLGHQDDFPAANSTLLIKSSHGMGLHVLAEQLVHRVKHAI